MVKKDLALNTQGLIKHNIFLVLLFISVFIALVIPAVKIAAQANITVRQEPQIVGDLWLDNQFVKWSALVADQEGKVHLVWGLGEHPPDRGRTEADVIEILYSRYDTYGWTEPLPLVYAPQGNVYPRLAIDNDGYLYLSWRGDCIYLIRAHVARAHNFHAWTTPQTCAAPLPLRRFDMTVGPDNAIYIASTTREGQLIVAKSTDKGDGWSAPQTVTWTDGVNPFIDEPSLHVDSVGRVHLFYVELPPTGYPAQGLYYTRSIDGGESWIDPVAFSEAQQLEASMASNGNQLYMVWNGQVGDGKRYFRMSQDGGETWGETMVQMHLPPAGTTGRPAIDIDAAGNVYALVGTDSGYFFQQWLNSDWYVVERLSTEQEGWDPSLTIALGNQVHLAWYSGLNLAHAIYRTNAPALPPQAYPESSDENFHKSNNLFKDETQEQAPEVEFSPAALDDSMPRRQHNSFRSLFIVLVPVITLLMIVVVSTVIGRRY